MMRQGGAVSRTRTEILAFCSAVLVAGSLLLASCDEAPKPGPGASPRLANAGTDEVIERDRVAPTEAPLDGAIFESFADKKQKGERGLPQLRNGYVADSNDWPTVFYVTFQKTPNGPRSACTAALIGPQVILTAAHCVPPGGKIDLSFKGAGYATECTRHPQYEAQQDWSADYALCKLSGDKRIKPEPAQTAFYEYVDVTPFDTLTSKDVILTGFGCTADRVGSGSPDGKLRYGGNVIVETSASKHPSRSAEFYAGSQDNNLFTEDRKAGDPLPNLCPGDSGGPAFLATSTGDVGKRVLVGVNSRVFYRSSAAEEYGASLVSAVGTKEFETWARAWMDDKAEICGLTTPMAACRH